jgi:hypothetical protein
VPGYVSCTFDPKPKALVEAQVAFMKAFNVAGTFFQVGAKKYWFKQRTAGNFEILRRLYTETDEIPVWLSCQLEKQSSDARADPEPCS